LGVPCGDEYSHPEAMEHNNEIMAGAVKPGPGTRVLDLGCGDGSTARYLAASRGCQVTGTNIRHMELDLACENREALLPRIGADTIDRTLADLSFWVNSANAGYTEWALFVATKPE